MELVDNYYSILKIKFYLYLNPAIFKFLTNEILAKGIDIMALRNSNCLVVNYQMNDVNVQSGALKIRCGGELETSFCCGKDRRTYVTYSYLLLSFKH